MLKSFKRNSLHPDNAELRKLIESDLKKDLHLHTYYSDGELSPREVIDRMAAEGCKLLSITDHDGIEGSVEGAPYALNKGIAYIYGIEFDSEDELGRDLHILGYGFDPHNIKLRKVLLEILLKRARRNDRFMEALNSRGYNISFEDIGAVNSGRYIGKPTFALIMKNKGIVETVQKAFETVFKENDLRSIKKETLKSKEVIDVIHEAGGLAVLAHPMEQRHTGESFSCFKNRLIRLLDRMVEYGIDGLECGHPSASPEQQQMLEDYAREHGLMITCGSDFHSDRNKRDFSEYHRM